MNEILIAITAFLIGGAIAWLWRAARAVAYGWRQEALAKNAQEVADLGRQLYERIAMLATHWTDVGNRLDKAVEAYNKSVATLETRVLVSARRLRDLKAAPEDTEIEAIGPAERTARVLQAVANSREEDANDNPLKAHP